ncbi:MAG: hypothetical protein AB1505_18855 [Candidatus Latescibacterota bacterium]
MLGEMLGQASGKVSGVRVLPTEGQQIKVEVSFQGTGELCGVTITNIGTYWQSTRAGGVLHGEGHVLMMDAEGHVVDWVCGQAHTAPGRFARLGEVATVIEYDVDQDWGYRWKLWEWK